MSRGRLEARVQPLIQRTRGGPQLEKVRYERVRVAVTHGPDTGLVLEAAGRTLRVGTAHDGDLVLTDDTVSRQHCEIELSEGSFSVRDLRSTNGVRYGGVRIVEVECNTAVELSLGETTLCVTPLAQSESRERARTHRFGDLIGSSPKMRELFAALAHLSQTNLSVLIEGETGTGKDLVAESLHRHSQRASGPYVVFDCSAVAPTLVESELFGHEHGAFTGAALARPGVFEEAHGGTLFLDEIGELPRELQPKLLRALEKREVRRLGGRQVKTVDVRIVAATNRNLAAEVRANNFRQDLFYRIAGARVHVPPLRERMEDIAMLVDHFLALDAPKLRAETISPQVWDMFKTHRWPGNVRELRNAVQRLLATPGLAPSLDEERWGPRAVAPAGSAPGSVEPLREARRRAHDAFEQAYLRELLQRTQGNISRAAAIAEVSRQMIQKMLRKYGISAATAGEG